ASLDMTSNIGLCAPCIVGSIVGALPWVNYNCQISFGIDKDTTILLSTTLFIEKGHAMLTQGWRIRAVFAIVLVCGAILVGARNPAPLAAAGEVVFRIGGDIERPQQWTLDDLAALPRREVHARDRDGTEVTFAGVALVEILRLAGVPLGEKLRGSNMALYLLGDAAGWHPGG